jgi:hypothetical protein
MLKIEQVDCHDPEMLRQPADDPPPETGIHTDRMKQNQQRSGSALVVFALLCSALRGRA